MVLALGARPSSRGTIYPRATGRQELTGVQPGAAVLSTTPRGPRDENLAFALKFLWRSTDRNIGPARGPENVCTKPIGDSTKRRSA